MHDQRYRLLGVIQHRRGSHRGTVRTDTACYDNAYHDSAKANIQQRAEYGIAAVSIIIIMSAIYLAVKEEKAAQHLADLSETTI